MITTTTETVVPNPDANDAESFVVRDRDSANWVIRKILECRAYADRCAVWADAERHRAQQDEQSLLFRYGSQLAEFVRQQIEAGGMRRKSINLPAGTVGFRSEAAKIIVDDDAAILAWAKEHEPALVTVVEHVSKSKLNEAIEATGEIPPVGVHVEPAREKFYIK